MPYVSMVVGLILAGYIIWEVVQFVPQYRKLKAAIANGDPQARIRIYRRATVFEWISALLAVLALGLDWSKLNPAALSLESIPWIQQLPHGSDFNRGSMLGVLAGLVMGTIGFVLMRMKANRRVVADVPEAPSPWWKRLLPDFSALVPITTQERILWTVVAISAGVCEEVVFRGWLLASLHTSIGLNGTALLLAGAVLFGLAHAYQGVSGILLTAFAGAFFCGLYVASGSLLLPILLHIFVDARFAILPAPIAQKPRAAYSH